MSESFHEASEPAPDETRTTLTQVAPPELQSTEFPSTELESTGNEDVDRVVASLARLDELPVAEHVAVFEQAHDALRRTLAGAGHDGPAADRS